MRKVLVIADDLTGAAEIAGTGLRYGLPTRLVRDHVVTGCAGLTVIDTDSRLLRPSEAAAAVLRVVRRAGEGFDLIYKKTDSVLRGPVLAELEAVMLAFDKPAAVLVPQNPSLGRTIRAGEYRIDGIRLNASSFADDPEYPARTSDVLELLGKSARHARRYMEPGQSPAADGITIGAGCRADELRQWAASLASYALPAGGADFFQAILEQHGLSASHSHHTNPARARAGTTLFVCGSASAYSHELAERAGREGVSVCAMPDGIFHAFGPASALEGWVSEVAKALEAGSRALMTIGRPPDRAPGASQRLQGAMAEAVSRVLECHRVQNLLLEGGSTASAICRKLNWHQFDVLGELARGVVQMRARAGADHQGQVVVVKPGSYRWPDVVWERE